MPSLVHRAQKIRLTATYKDPDDSAECHLQRRNRKVGVGGGFDGGKEIGWGGWATGTKSADATMRARARARSACWNGHTDLGMRLIDLGGDELLLSKAKTGARAATRPSPHPPHHPPASPQGGQLCRKDRWPERAGKLGRKREGFRAEKGRDSASGG